MNDWVIRLSDLEFVPDSTRLTPQGLARVDSVGAMLAQWPMLRFEVGVHSDNLGEDARRQPLSHLRARYILQQIYAKHPNLNPKNYYYTGYGDTQPIASNKTAEGRALNRRAEFKLLSMDTLTKERERRESLGTTAVPPAPGTGHGGPGEPGGPTNERAPSPPPGSGSAPQGGAGSGAQGAAGAVPSGAAQGKPPAASAAQEKESAGPIPHAPTPPSPVPPAPSRPDSIPPPPPAPPDSVR